MKKTIVKIGISLLGLFLLVGIVSCILRPAYVREAVGILFQNELDFEESVEESTEESGAE